MDVSNKWLRKARYYKWFAREYSNADFSDSAAEAMYIFESTGKGNVNHYDAVDGMVNGYALGKHLQDLQLAMWREDLARPFMLSKYELFTDPELAEIKEFLNYQFGPIMELEVRGNSKNINDAFIHIRKYMY